MPSIKFSDNVHLVADMLLTQPSDCASYLVRGERAVLIDCGSGLAHERLLGNLARLGVRPADIDCVIATHGHYDHIAGLDALRRDNPDIRLAAHVGDVLPIETADPERTCAGWFFGAEMAPLRVDAQFSGGETFRAGGLDFDIHHTPGHTPGSICVGIAIDGRRFLFTGDSLAPGNERVLSDYDAWRETLDRVLAIDADFVLPGHSMQWLGSPFNTALAPVIPSAIGRAAYRFMADRLTRPIWAAAVFNYSYISPAMAKFGAKK